MKWLKSDDSKTDEISASCNYPDAEEDISSISELSSDNSFIEENTAILNNDNNLLDHNLFDLYIKKNGELLDPSDIIAKLVESGILTKEPTLLSMFGDVGFGVVIASVGVLGIGCLSVIYPNKTIEIFKTINLI